MKFFLVTCIYVFCLNIKNIWASFEQIKIWESRKQKLLHVEIDSSLNFELYFSILYKKAGKKLSVLAQLFIFMSLNQR